jgi:hypothetical protein
MVLIFGTCTFVALKRGKVSDQARKNEKLDFCETELKAVVKKQPTNQEPLLVPFFDLYQKFCHTTTLTFAVQSKQHAICLKEQK